MSDQDELPQLSANPTIRETQAYIWGWIERKGWKDDRRPGELIALMHSELSEALEEIRNNSDPERMYYSLPSGDTIEEDDFLNQLRDGSSGPSFAKPEGFGIELADCVIRIFHACANYDIDLASMITLKLKYNETRSHRHGNKNL